MAASEYEPRTIHLWKVMLDWIGFFVQIFLQILSGMPQFQFKPVPVVELHEISNAGLHSPAEGQRGSGQGAPLEKLMVVLDLDETLVCAYETSSLPANLRDKATKAGVKWFELECFSSDKDIEGKPKTNNVTVFERPGLKDFLKQLSEFADLVLFTAGLEGYAKPVIDRIDVNNVFIRRLYRPSTVSTQYRDHVKDLSCLSKDLCRVVIVDNNPFSFLMQPLNGIPCAPFSPAHPRDAQLMEFILPLLKHLSVQKDIRPILYQKFHMPEWFEKHGIPVDQIR